MKQTDLGTFFPSCGALFGGSSPAASADALNLVRAEFWLLETEAATIALALGVLDFSFEPCEAVLTLKLRHLS